MAISLRDLWNHPERIEELRIHNPQDKNALYIRNPVTGETEPTDLYYELLGNEIEQHPISTPRIYR